MCISSDASGLGFLLLFLDGIRRGGSHQTGSIQEGAVGGFNAFLTGCDSFRISRVGRFGEWL